MKELLSYTVLTDFANQGYLANTANVAGLWPHLLFQYSLNSSPVPVDMVYGEFVDPDNDDEDGENDVDAEEEDEEEEEQ